MTIQLTSDSKSSSFTARNNRGGTIVMTGDKTAPDMVSPMEAVLAATAGCSSIDVEMILKKMRQDVERIEVQVDGVRADSVPAVFTSIHLAFTIVGPVLPAKAEQAVQMSMEKYCSVTRMLAPSVDIDWKVEVASAPKLV